MAELERLDFEERDGQWFITEVYRGGHFKAGEPFMASGHERFTKLEQVLQRASDQYPSYRLTHIPYDKVNAKSFVFGVVQNQTE
jgi:hypothetical protein